MTSGVRARAPDESAADRGAPANVVTREIDSAIESCREALEQPDMLLLAKMFRSRGLAEGDCVTLIEQVGRHPGAAQRVSDLREELSIGVAQPAALEQCLLLLTVAQYSAQLARLSMSDGVLRCLAHELQFLAAPASQDRAKLLAPSDGFAAMAKVVTLRRFPAGQLHFERSGIPLSWLVHLSPARLTKVLLFLARHGRSRRPFFVHHLAWRRPNRLFLSEIEQNRSYHRMARSLERHPGVKGILTESWLHSPETFRVSPHLAWLNRPFVENGGLIVEIREVSEESGVFTNSRERKRLYDEGQFRPTTAMVIWPRASVLAWADRHPEFGD